MSQTFDEWLYEFQDNAREVWNARGWRGIAYAAWEAGQQAMREPETPQGRRRRLASAIREAAEVILSGEA